MGAEGLFHGHTYYNLGGNLGTEKDLQGNKGSVMPSVFI